MILFDILSSTFCKIGRYYQVGQLTEQLPSRADESRTRSRRSLVAAAMSNIDEMGQKMSTTEDANEPRTAGSRSLSKYLHSQSERPHAGRSDRQIYF